MECERCLFGHGSKPESKVWRIAAPGVVLCAYSTGTYAHTGMCDDQKHGLTGIGTHATLVSEWRVLPSSGSVVGTECAQMRLLTGRRLYETQQSPTSTDALGLTLHFSSPRVLAVLYTC